MTSHQLSEPTKKLIDRIRLLNSKIEKLKKTSSFRDKVTSIIYDTEITKLTIENN